MIIIYLFHIQEDKDKAFTLKEYFESVNGLKVFVDSEAWNSVLNI